MRGENSLLIEYKADVSGKEKVSASAEIKHEKYVAEKREDKSRQQEQVIGAEIIELRKFDKGQHQIHRCHKILVYCPVDLLFPVAGEQIAEKRGTINDYEPERSQFFRLLKLKVRIQRRNVYLHIGNGICAARMYISELDIRFASVIVFAGCENVISAYDS